VNRSETEDLLRKFRRELEDAERVAKDAINQVDSLRRVVRGLEGVLGIEEPATARVWAGSARGAARSRSRVVRENLQQVQEAQQALMEDTVAAVAVLNGEDAPRGREAVRRILVEARRQMHIDEIVKEALRRGWMLDVSSPKNALTAAAKRLVDDGELERRGRAVYRYRLDKLPAPETKGGSG